MHLCSRAVRYLTLLFVCSPISLIAQAPAPAAPAPQQPDYTRPQTQQPMDVDRDPVHSPDPDLPPAQSPLGRDTRGQFTLQRDVEEVVLNATVVDDHGRFVSLRSTRTTSRYLKTAYPRSSRPSHTRTSRSPLPSSSTTPVPCAPSARPVNESAIDLVKASNPDDESMIVQLCRRGLPGHGTYLRTSRNCRTASSHIESKGGTALYDAVNRFGRLSDQGRETSQAGHPHHHRW